MKYWNLADAEALIPDLEKIFKDLVELSAQAQAKSARLARLEDKPAEAAIERAQIQFLANEMTALMQDIVDLGAVPKGLEPALVDFPSRVEGRDAYLCWKLGEKKIEYYHGFEEGFGGRKKLPK